MYVKNFRLVYVHRGLVHKRKKFLGKTFEGQSMKKRKPRFPASQGAVGIDGRWHSVRNYL